MPDSRVHAARPGDVPAMVRLGLGSPLPRTPAEVCAERGCWRFTCRLGGAPLWGLGAS